MKKKLKRKQNSQVHVSYIVSISCYYSKPGTLLYIPCHTQDLILFFLFQCLETTKRGRGELLLKKKQISFIFVSTEIILEYII